MKFLADGMLGKLSRWLRMLGCDVKYYNNINDEELLKTAKNERRILLTCDVQLYKQASTRNVQSYLLKGSTETERLAEIAQQFNIKLNMDVQKSRCPKCNAKLQSVQKEKIADKIPYATSRLFDKYWMCTDCGQVYWQGSHWRKIDRKLKETKMLMPKKQNFLQN